VGRGAIPGQHDRVPHPSRIAAELDALLVESHEDVAARFRGQVIQVQLVGEAGGEPHQLRFAIASHDDPRMRPLHRLGFADCVVEAVVPAVEAEARPRPQADQDLELLLQHLEPLAHRRVGDA